VPRDILTRTANREWIVEKTNNLSKKKPLSQSVIHFCIYVASLFFFSTKLAKPNHNKKTKKMESALQATFQRNADEQTTYAVLHELLLFVLPVVHLDPREGMGARTRAFERAWSDRRVVRAFGARAGADSPMATSGGCLHDALVAGCKVASTASAPVWRGAFIAWLGVYMRAIFAREHRAAPTHVETLLTCVDAALTLAGTETQRVEACAHAAVARVLCHPKRTIADDAVWRAVHTHVRLDARSRPPQASTHARIVRAATDQARRYHGVMQRVLERVCTHATSSLDAPAVLELRRAFVRHDAPVSVVAHRNTTAISRIQARVVLAPDGSVVFTDQWDRAERKRTKAEKRRMAATTTTTTTTTTSISGVSTASAEAILLPATSVPTTTTIHSPRPVRHVARSAIHTPPPAPLSFPGSAKQVIGATPPPLPLPSCTGIASSTDDDDDDDDAAATGDVNANVSSGEDEAADADADDADADVDAPPAQSVAPVEYASFFETRSGLQHFLATALGGDADDTEHDVSLFSHDVFAPQTPTVSIAAKPIATTSPLTTTARAILRVATVGAPTRRLVLSRVPLPITDAHVRAIYAPFGECAVHGYATVACGTTYVVSFADTPSAFLAYQATKEWVYRMEPPHAPEPSLLWRLAPAYAEERNDALLRYMPVMHLFRC
jgi:hypothetical protein